MVSIQAIKNWFNPDAEPVGDMPRQILIVPCQTHARLEHISPEGLWTQTVTYVLGDATITHQKGTSAGNVLGGWRKVRDQMPDGQWQNEFVIWGQPSAWADTIICNWMSDYIAETYGQTFQIVDCLGSMWQESTLQRCWANQQYQIPIAPNATSFLQVADTHVHARLKAFIREAKGDLEEEWDRSIQISGGPRLYEWGPWHCCQILGEALSKFRAAEESERIFVRAFVQNQLLVYRPDQDGQLQPVDDQTWARQCPRLPPGRGIPPRVAQQRVGEIRDAWQGGEPPEPDWAILDNLGNYLEQGHDAPEDEDQIVEIDCRFEGLQLTEEQIHMMRPPEERLATLQKVRPAVADLTAAQKNRCQHKARSRFRSRWSAKFQKRHHQKASNAWKKRLEDAGGLEGLKSSLTPVLAGAKGQALGRLALQRQAKAEAKAKGQITNGKTIKGAKQIAKRQNSGPIVQKSDQIILTECSEHQLLSQTVRVIDPAGASDRFGQAGVVSAVHQRSSGGSSSEMVVLRFSEDPRDAAYFPLEWVRPVADEAACLEPRPIKLDYQRFRAERKAQVKAQLGCGQDGASLDAVSDGQLLDDCQIYAGVLEIQQRLQLGATWAAEPPASSPVLSLPDADCSVLLKQLQGCTLFSMIVHQSNHYTYLEARRNATTDDWQMFYHDSLGSALDSCYQTAQTVARTLQLLGPATELPASSGGRQTDGWSCGLWALQLTEARARQHRGEIPTRAPAITHIQARLNEYIAKLKGSAAPVKRQAKVLPVFDTLEQALTAAHQCAKCRPTLRGTKGCAQCMGRWFAQIRIRGALCATYVRMFQGISGRPAHQSLLTWGGVHGRGPPHTAKKTAICNRDLVKKIHKSYGHPEPPKKPEVVRIPKTSRSKADTDQTETHQPIQNGDA